MDGTTVKERRCQAAFTPRKPFRDCFRRGWPVGRFAGAQQETEGSEAVKPTRQRSQHRDDRVTEDAKCETSARADSIHELAENRLPDGVRDAESDREIRIVAIGPVVLGLEIGSQPGERLAVDVVDDG